MLYRDSTRNVQAQGVGDRCARLAAANVNPATGLASDYLNHFNEAIMLLEMLADCAECMGAFLAWRPKNYREHFIDSDSECGQIAVAAYDLADPDARARLETLTDAMTAVLEATRTAINAGIRTGMSPTSVAAVAGHASAALRPLVARAGAVINGEPAMHGTPSPQLAVDALMRAG